MQRLIERPSARVEPATRLRRDVLPDYVSVRRSNAERNQDVKRQIGERPVSSYIIHHAASTVRRCKGLLAGIVLGTIV